MLEAPHTFSHLLLLLARAPGCHTNGQRCGLWGLPPAATRQARSTSPVPAPPPATRSSRLVPSPCAPSSLVSGSSILSGPSQTPTHSSDPNSLHFPRFGELIPERSLGSSKCFGGYSRPSTNLIPQTTGNLPLLEAPAQHPSCPLYGQQHWGALTLSP